MNVAIVINPVSGTGGRPEVARDRAAVAAAFLQSHGIDGEVQVTEYRGHARELAAAALGRGASLVVAWGGDGTVNEVGTALAFRDAVLGIVPSGSGNGLARELGIPFDPHASLAVAVRGVERRIDSGEIDGHLFFNVAGLGLDARVAHEFAALGLLRRGFRRYVEITTRELFRNECDEHEITADGIAMRRRTLMVAIANGRQYGNGAIIAPRARRDDGPRGGVVV